MNVKSLKKQLVAAIAMVIVAAVALSSSTYAWFAANNTVNATAMQVVARSNDTFLLISSDKSSASEIQTQGLITVPLTIESAAAKVYPSAPAMNDTEVGYLTTSGKDVDGASITTAGVKITNATTAANVTNWYTAKALAANASTIKPETARQLKNFTGYVIHKTLYMTVASGSDAATNLKVTPTFTQKDGGNDIDAAKILLVTSDGACAVLKNGDSAVDIKGSNSNLTDQSVLTVDLYIYVDGNDDAVFTNNAAYLKGADFTLEFTVDTVTS